MIDVQRAAKAIGIPVEEWPGKCHEIAHAIVKAGCVEGEAVYGHWTGPVSRKCKLFYETSSKAGFVRHGWIVRKDGSVVDPTRWVFEGKAPYIFEGGIEDECMHCGHIECEHADNFFRSCELCGEAKCPGYEVRKWPYDEGGNAIRKKLQNERPCPKYEGGRPTKFKIKDPEVRSHLEMLVPSPRWTLEQIVWVSNLSYDTHNTLVWRVYKTIEANDLLAFIPIDNYRRAKREAGA